MDDVYTVYSRLKDQYPIELTDTDTLDDGFGEKLPIVVAKTHGHILYLYDWGGDLVLDVMNAEKTKGCHWHPVDAEAAAGDVAAFMEGKNDYPLTDYRA